MDAEIQKIVANKKIFDIQCASTKAALMQSDDDRLTHLLTPIPKEAQVRDEDGNVFLNHRSLSYEEVKVYDKLRYDRGEHIANIRGDGDASSTTIHKKLSAINAFMDIFSIDRIKQKFRDIMKGVKHQSYHEMVAEHMKEVMKSE